MGEKPETAADEPGPKTDPKRPKQQPVRFDRGSHVELAAALITKLEVVERGRLVAPVYDEGHFWAYEPDLGIWRRLGDSEAGLIVQGFDGSRVGKKQFLKTKDSDVKGALSCARRAVNKEGFFGGVSAGLVFKGGAMRVIEGGKIEKAPLSSAHRARHAYDFDYVDEEPTGFLKALEGMFLPDVDKQDKIRLIGEFAGVSLLGAATRLQRWIFLKGDGDDGKSTLIELIRSAFPPGSTSSIKPDELEDEYARADLAGKLLNTVTEVGHREYLRSETLKALTVGDEMRGRPIRQSPISFKPLAGHIVAANGFLKFLDSSHGFWRRPIVVPFNRRFTNDPERDPELAGRIIRSERQRMVCWLVRQGAAALARGKYIEPPSHAEALKEWRGDTDAVFQFVEEKLVQTKKEPPSQENGWSYPQRLYESFKDWANNTGHRAMSSNAFGRRLTELGYPEARSAGKRYRPLRVLKTHEIKHPDGSVTINN